MPVLVPLLEALTAAIAAAETVGAIVISVFVLHGLITRIIGLVRRIGKD